MCIDTVSLPNVSRYDDISLHLYWEALTKAKFDKFDSNPQTNTKL